MPRRKQKKKISDNKIAALLFIVTAVLGYRAGHYIRTFILNSEEIKRDKEREKIYDKVFKYKKEYPEEEGPVSLFGKKKKKKMSKKMKMILASLLGGGLGLGAGIKVRDNLYKRKYEIEKKFEKLFEEEDKMESEDTKMIIASFYKRKYEIEKKFEKLFEEEDKMESEDTKMTIASLLGGSKEKNKKEELKKKKVKKKISAKIKEHYKKLQELKEILEKILEIKRKEGIKIPEYYSDSDEDKYKYYIKDREYLIKFLEQYGQYEGLKYYNISELNKMYKEVINDNSKENIGYKFGKKVKKIPASLKKKCKRLKIRLTLKKGGKRIYKSKAMLKKQCKKADKRRKK